MNFSDNKFLTTGLVKKVDNGSSVEIVCDSDGETSWYFKRKDNFEKIPVLENTLTLKSVTPDNAGTYICHGTCWWKILGNRFFLETHLKVFSKLFLYCKVGT